MNSGAGTKGTVGTPHNILTHTCAYNKVENNETMGEEGDGGEE
ncbi:hypothetical protein [Bacteroides ovatus]|nr:hypothetical protein [Bacteroides ovatus]